MKKIKCKECGKEISKKAEICPHCGCRVKSNTIKIIIICLIVIAILIGGYFGGKKLIKKINEYKSDLINKQIDNTTKEVYLYVNNDDDDMQGAEFKLNEKLDNDINWLSYESNYSNINKNVFLKFKVDDDNIIKKYEFCFKIKNNYKCIGIDDLENYEDKMNSIFNKSQCYKKYKMYNCYFENVLVYGFRENGDGDSYLVVHTYNQQYSDSMDKTESLKSEYVLTKNKLTATKWN